MAQFSDGVKIVMGGLAVALIATVAELVVLIFPGQAAPSAPPVIYHMLKCKEIAPTDVDSADDLSRKISDLTEHSDRSTSVYCIIGSKSGEWDIYNGYEG